MNITLKDGLELLKKFSQSGYNEKTHMIVKVSHSFGEFDTDLDKTEEYDLTQFLNSIGIK